MAKAKFNVFDEKFKKKPTWDQSLVNDPITAPGLKRIRAALKQREV